MANYSSIEKDSVYCDFEEMVMALNETIWGSRLDGDIIKQWLDNFTDKKVGDLNTQKLNALYLLSQFMFFGTNEVRAALKYIYEHLFMYPVIRQIRKDNNDTLNENLLNDEFQKILLKTRFLGMGNPSESGCHLLYYFRQENDLPKDYFVHAHELFNYKIDRKKNTSIIESLVTPGLEYYIFIDDLSGSGDQGKLYSEKIIENIKLRNPECKCFYYILFGTTWGIKEIREKTLFDSVECVFELDESFQAFNNRSRVFMKHIDKINRELCERMSQTYGSIIYKPNFPHGHKNGQFLLAMSHNTPDNTLPIFWSRDNKWVPIFPRFDKKYS